MSDFEDLLPEIEAIEVEKYNRSYVYGQYLKKLGEAIRQVADNNMSKRHVNYSLATNSKNSQAMIDHIHSKALDIIESYELHHQNEEE